jgi:hypothetical protein
MGVNVTLRHHVKLANCLGQGRDMGYHYAVRKRLGIRARTVADVYIHLHIGVGILGHGDAGFVHVW